MPSYSVTVRDEESGKTVHLAQMSARDERTAAYDAAQIPVSEWETGSAVIDFYQLDPELDTFSFAHYARLEDAQHAGLTQYREHMQIMNSPVGNLAYVMYPVPDDPELPNPDAWHITDSLHPARHITMCQIVKYSLVPGSTGN